MTLQVAYLVNDYPKVSHTFIRREILALERQGVAVQRIALRGWAGELPDAADAAERARTAYVLQRGASALLWPMVQVLVSAPARFGAALALALRMARRADRSLAYHLAYLAEACCTLRWLRASGATHLHAHFGTNPAEVAMLVHALGGPPYSFTIHGPEEFDRAGPLHLGTKVSRAAFVAVVSSFGRSQLFRWTARADWPKVKVIRCGLEAAFAAAAPPDAQPSSATRLVCVGRLCEQKGQLLLIEAAARLSRRGVNFELVLVGDGEMRSEVQTAIREAALTQRVRITGWAGSERVRDEMVAARALVLPSFAEGLPVVIMEAMALRRPVISTYVAGIPELVRSGETGWLVPAGDAEALASAMAACLATPSDALQRMGEAARRSVAAQHDVDKSAALLAALFRSHDVRVGAAS